MVMVNGRPVVETLCRSGGEVFEPDESQRYATACVGCQELGQQVREFLKGFNPREIFALARPLYFRAVATVTSERFIEASSLANQLYFLFEEQRSRRKAKQRRHAQNRAKRRESDRVSTANNKGHNSPPPLHHGRKKNAA